MRSIAVLSLFAAASAHAQLPIETDAMRVPTTKTGGNCIVRNGRVLTATGVTLDGADILIVNGKIREIAKSIAAPKGFTIIDAAGKFVTPGLVDAHSHAASDDTNEWSDAVVSETRIQDILNPDLVGVWQALGSGITSALILHGSANPIGGESVVVKYKWRQRYEQVIFPGAPRMVKFALGENPKRPGQGQSPQDGLRFPGTRLGVEAVIRRAFADARQYMKEWDAYRAGNVDAVPPRRDLRLETLAGILRGEVVVQCHSYRQDEMLMIARLSKELGFKLVLQHALESYKIAPELASLGVPVSIFGDAFAYKLEVVDSIPMASAILDRAGVLVSVNTDTDSGNVPLTVDAGKSMRYGVSEDRALRMVTLNPARELGIDRRVGSLEVGKDADIAIWQGHPLSTYTKCAMTLVDGEVLFERRDAFGVDARSKAATAVQARTIAVPDDYTPRAGTVGFLIRGATVHPVSSPVLPSADVLIRGERIVQVGKGLKGGPGIAEIPGKGLHLYPGFIDAGCNLGLVAMGQVPSGTDLDETSSFTPDLKALTAINPENDRIPTVRLNGVTNAVVMPVAGVVSGQVAFIHTAGSTNQSLDAGGPSGLYINVPEAPAVAELETMPADEREKAFQGVGDRRRQIRRWFESAKRTLDAGTRGRDIKLDAMAPYLLGTRPVIFGADGVDAIEWSLAFAKSFGLKPVIYGGGDAWRLVDKLKASGAGVILAAPSISCPNSNIPRNGLDPYDTPFVAPSLLQRAGVPVAFRTSSFDQVHNLPFMVGRTCAFGMTPEGALRAMTLDAATMFGLQADFGSVEAGKVANLVITDGDPMELTSQTHFVFVRGRPVSLRSHFTELWSKYAARK